MKFSTVPKPHAALEFYSLIFSPKTGLLKVVAYGKDIKISVYGEAVRSAFVEIRDAIANSYGPADINVDNLKRGSIWNEPGEWMMALYKAERLLLVGWGTKTTLPNQLLGIVLEAKALSTEKGFLSLAYEFNGWNEYVDEMKKKESTVF